jgi:hypothetical protein
MRTDGQNTEKLLMSLNQSAWQRACEDTECFRQSRAFFLGAEMLGGGVFAGVVAATTHRWTDSPSWQIGLYAAAGAMGGCFSAYVAAYVVNLFRAPRRQRDEARRELKRLLISSVNTKWVISSKAISLEVTNTAPDSIAATAKMLSIRYTEQGKPMLFPNGEYDIPWANTRLIADANWRTILSKKRDYLNLAALDGVSGEGRAREYGDGAVVRLPHVEVTNNESPQIVADLGSIIEYQIEIYSNPSFTTPVLRTIRVKATRQEVSPGEKNFDPKWELVSEEESKP